MDNKIIYLDNNSTTHPPAFVKKEILKWVGVGNPSSNDPMSLKCKSMIEEAKKYIRSYCNCENYEVIFTSGATESNCYILRAVCEAYNLKTKKIAHIITSSYEHKSILDCLKQLEMCGICTTTYIRPDMHGFINPSMVAALIKPNTALISIMYANNELGTINNIKEIGEIAHKNKIPLHTDAVQMFGKYKINIPENCIDVLSASFHKLYGPQGIGLLVVNKTLIEGYGLHAIVHGSQFGGLRGGTENVPGIGGALAAMQVCFENRSAKNEKMQELKNLLIDALRKKYKEGKIDQYNTMGVVQSQLQSQLPTNAFEFVILGNPNGIDNMLPNTLSVAFCKNVDLLAQKNAKKFCNVDLKKCFANEYVYLSISSACLTDSTKASHVLEAIGANPTIKCGMIRIAMSDYTTKKNIQDFIKIMYKLVDRQLADLK